MLSFLLILSLLSDVLNSLKNLCILSFQALQTLLSLGLPYSALLLLDRSALQKIILSRSRHTSSSSLIIRSLSRNFELFCLEVPNFFKEFEHQTFNSLLYLNFFYICESSFLLQPDTFFGQSQQA